jgi:CheY-like chemotaxis protein
MPDRAKAARKKTEPLAGARVLVVDDHAFTASLVRDLLYAAGARSVTATRDGEEALSALRYCQPHLVITDWRMPNLDGLAFTRIVRRAAVKADPRVPNPQVPIVLLSAHASVQTVETARLAGVTEVLAKPFTTAALIQRIAAAMADPRAFVVAGDYVGPDRRRREAGGRKARRANDPEPAPFEEEDSVLSQLQSQLDAFESRPRKAMPE